MPVGLFSHRGGTLVPPRWENRNIHSSLYLCPRDTEQTTHNMDYKRKRHRHKLHEPKPLSQMSHKERLYTIIFEADTPEGKLFDVLLLVFIGLSIGLLIIDSMQLVPAQYTHLLTALEWLITLFFSVEYALRLYCSPRPKEYALSFYGLVDLISTLPLYVSFFSHAAFYLTIVRAFRLIRVFRVFRLFGFIAEGNLLLMALKESRRKIFVFFLFVFILSIALGTLMHIIEGQHDTPGFENILSSIYWTIVTLTGVGYGDITPITPLGRFFSAAVMLLGYTIIAVPTGVVSVSIMKQSKLKPCPACNKKNDDDAIHCKYCGQRIMPHI